MQQVDSLVDRADVPPTWKSFWSRQICTTPTVILRLLNSRLAALSDVGVAHTEPDPMAADLGPAEEEAALETFLLEGQSFEGEKVWLEGLRSQVERWHLAEPDLCARFAAVRDRVGLGIGSGNSRLLVFAQSRYVVTELAAVLSADFGADAIAVITHDLADDRIAEVSRRFESNTKCMVLLSDEIGAEGRNFQFADAVIHLDQPFIVARLEQRIGRLDRIGRTEDQLVLSVAILGPSDIRVCDAGVPPGCLSRLRAVDWRTRVLTSAPAAANSRGVLRRSERSPQTRWRNASSARCRGTAN